MGKNLLKTLIPINSLTPENFTELAGATSIENLSTGNQLFKQGGRDNHSISVVRRSNAFSSDAVVSRNVVAGTDEARYTLVQLKPRQRDGTATTPVAIALAAGAPLDGSLT